MIAQTAEEVGETRLVGDSILRGQLIEFCGRAPNNRKRYCIPGARLDDITEVCGEVTSDAVDNTLYIIHAGTNDVSTTTSEELLEKYRKMIRQFKTKTNNIVISGILPRMDAGWRFYGKALTINHKLDSLCSQEGVDFVNLWEDFHSEPLLFHYDGLHLNSVGHARLGRLLSNQVSLYRSKNAERTRTETTT